MASARLFAGTKGADVLALDPDANGKVLFRVNPSGSRSASPDAARRDRVGRRHRSTAGVLRHGRRGLGAVQSPDGKTAWVFTAPGAAAAARGARRGADRDPRRRVPGFRRRPALRGVGHDGKQLWEFNTAQDIATVNKVPRARRRDATAGASSWTAWSTSVPDTRSAAAHLQATCCSRLVWISRANGDRGENG
jgi:hypothetical protein